MEVELTLLYLEKYLQKCLPDEEFIETSFDEEPIFLKEKELVWN